MPRERSWRATVGAVGALAMAVFFATALAWSDLDEAPAWLVIPAGVLMLTCVPVGMWETYRMRQQRP